MKAGGGRPFQATAEQQMAVEHVNGPMLVVAGAGTGKTSVLTRRVARLIAEEKVKPEEILAVTYTRNAAGELLERVGELLYQGDPQAANKLEASGLQARTFHSYCRDVLRDAGIEFELIDDKDLFVLLRQRQEELGLEHFTKAADPGKFLQDLTGFFRRCHDELRMPDDYDAYVARLERKEIAVPRVAKSKDAGVMTDAEVLQRCREIARVYRYTEDLLEREGLGTFGHLITRTVAQLAKDGALLARARRRARFVLIDEFQDSNVAQIRLAKLLGGEDANVFAVGDPDQAVYRFRGASSGTFDQFLRTFGPARVKRVTMVKNRRSTPQILRCAFEAISPNAQIGSVVLEGGPWERKPLECGRLDEEPELSQAAPVRLAVHNGDEQEARFVADAIAEIRKNVSGATWADFAVLYRNHSGREEIVAELRRRQIPFAVKGLDLFETYEVRDALAALRLIDASDPIALFRFAALSQFVVDPVAFRSGLAAADGVAVEKVLEKVSGGLAVVETLREFRHDVQNAGGSLAAALKVLTWRIGLRRSMPGRCLAGFAERWLEKPKAISGGGSLREFLAYFDLYRLAGGGLCEPEDADPVGPSLLPLTGADSDAVQLMTVHAAKGLERPYVFALRIVSGSCPNNYRETLVEFPAELRDKDTEGAGDPRILHDEEERRLFYVAMTRAKQRLYLCGKRARGKEAVPSKYLRNLAGLKDTLLRGAIDVDVLSAEAVVSAADAVRPEPSSNLARWMALPIRPDARVKELSASAIQDYDRCPLAFKLSRDWRIPSEPVAAMQYGAAMHLALKAHFDGLAAGRPRTEEEVIECFLDEFAKAKIEEALQRRMYEKDGREELTRFLRSDLAKPTGSILRNESGFRVKVGETVVKGTMDRIDRLDGERVVIVDYKTGTPQEQKEADKNLQLSVYALAARRMGMEPAKLVLVNLQNTSEVCTGRTTESDVATEAKVAEVAAKIAAGEFEPKTNFFCERCNYFTICPAQEVELERAADDAAGDEAGAFAAASAKS